MRIQIRTSRELFDFISRNMKDYDVAARQCLKKEAATGENICLFYCCYLCSASRNLQSENERRL